MSKRSVSLGAIGLSALGLVAVLAPAQALATNPFSHMFGKPAATAAAPSANDKGGVVADQIRQALDEKRYVDAADLLDKAKVDNVTSPRLTTLEGELMLARGRFSDAVMIYRKVDTVPTERALALTGEGLSLSLMGKSSDAFADLKEATTLDKTEWRAWNGLGREYDLRQDWKNSKIAYTQALACPGVNAAMVLNNRGYSHLLQKQTDDAAADFVAALDKDPDLKAARTNLRITMAIEGKYDRASESGQADDKATVLNNVGLAAAIRGDYPEAEKLLTAALEARGNNYERAQNNLQLSKDLEARAVKQSATPDVAP